MMDLDRVWTHINASAKTVNNPDIGIDNMYITGQPLVTSVLVKRYMVMTYAGTSVSSVVDNEVVGRKTFPWLSCRMPPVSNSSKYSSSIMGSRGSSSDDGVRNRTPDLLHWEIQKRLWLG